MKERVSPQVSMPAGLVVVAAACCVWILGATWARRVVAPTLGAHDEAWSGTAFILNGAAAAATALVLATVSWNNVSRTKPWTRAVVVAVYSVLVSALMATGRLLPADHVACLLLVTGFVAGFRFPSPIPAVLAFGVATGVSPFCALCVIVLLGASRRGKSRWFTLFAWAGTSILAALILNVFLGRHYLGAAQAWSDVGRLGPQDVWRAGARWTDLAMPVIVLAALAVAERFFGAASRKAPDGLAFWLIAGIAVAIVFPSAAIDHGLILIVPAVLLAASGFDLLVQLPISRDDWSLSFFSIACRALPFALLAVPLRDAGRTMLVALLPA